MLQSDINAVAKPIPNVDKLYAVLDAIEANPEQWDQAHWSRATECGTSMCFAGWTVHLEGIKLAVEVDGDNSRCSRTAEDKDISILASSILGLTSEEEYQLFVGSLYDRDGLQYHRLMHREAILDNVKFQVAKISARAKEQSAAFDRIAKELIESVPELEHIGPICPEARELVLKYLGGQDGDN